MPLLTKQKFSFISKGMDKDTFTVVSFKGFEAISKPYEFDILLVSDKKDVDPLQVLKDPAVFTIHRDEEDDVDFNGILMRFEETREYNEYFFFKAVLVPKLWWLSLTHHNQVFLNKTAPEIMEDALKDGGLAPGIDFSFDLMNTYLPFEYICQYDENHFNFVSRWAQREGIYYFFEQAAAGEKVVFTDSKIAHKDLLPGKDLYYDPPSGLAGFHAKEVIHSFVCRHNMLPQKIHLKDYNYLKPSMAVEGMADVDENGRGENYIYGDHFDDPEEGNRLAAIRAEGLLCKKSEFSGESSVPFMVPGYTFDLHEHYKKGYNVKYLVTEVVHEGHQTGYLIAGLSAAVARHDEEMFYSNSFTAIYSDKQFRAPHDALKPRISGSINAKIDAAGSGQYAEIDEYGRYKVILPFDLSGRFNGKASAWFRMMQPYAGENQGMHFPLHKGTEVLLTFIDGNPDRPVISGAVPNPETSSPVKDQNQTKSIITTGKNIPDPSVGAAAMGAMTTSGSWTTTPTDNYIEFEDYAGSERIRLHSDHDLWLEAQNRYADYQTGVPTTAETRPTHVADLIEKMYEYDSSAFAPKGFEPFSDQVPYVKSTAGGDTTTVDYGTMSTDAEKWKYLVDKGKVTVARGDTFNTQEGNIYDFGGYWNYNLGNCYVEEHLNQKGELNKTRSKDLLDKGGPGWTKVDWSKAFDSDADKGPGESDIEIGSSSDWKDSGSGTNVWVNKTIGNAYTYSQGHAIEVSKGDSLSIQHGGKHVDIAYRGDDSIKSWSWSSAGVSKEKKWTSDGFMYYESQYEASTGIGSETKWDAFSEKKVYNESTNEASGTASVTTYCRDSGKMLSYTSSHQGANSVHSHEFNWANTAKSSFTFAAGMAFSLDMSMQVALNTKMAGSMALNLVGGVAAEMNLPLGPNIKIEFDKSTLKIEIDATGTTIKLAGVELEMKQALAKVFKENALAKIAKYGAIGISNGYKFSVDKGGMALQNLMMSINT